MNKDTLCWEAFFPWELYTLPTLLQSLSSDAWGQDRLNSSLLNLEGQRCLTSSCKYQQKTKCPYGQSNWVFFTIKHFGTNPAAEKWLTATWTAESMSCGRNSCCFLPVVNWGVSGAGGLCVSSAASMLLVSPQGPRESPAAGTAALGSPGCSHSHTQGRHKPGTLERKEERAICLANFSASILMAANSNSSCQRVWWGVTHRGKKMESEQRKKA